MARRPQTQRFVEALRKAGVKAPQKQVARSPKPSGLLPKGRGKGKRF